MVCRSTCPSPIGELTLACDGDMLTGLWLAGQKYFAQTLPEDAADCGAAPVLDAARDWLARYFAGARPAADELPLRPAGTPFQQTVWRLLLDIPYGETESYGALSRRVAAALGRTAMSARAIGAAVGRNPISIIIPCHRVVGADGCLTGYAGGLAAKRFLLAHEGAPLPPLRDAGAPSR